MPVETIEVKSFGDIRPKQGANTRTLYDHQKDAMASLDRINAKPDYSTLVVLPTGGGKTYTASTWLLKNALDRGKKILWLAHRQMLLEQAAESFRNYAYAEAIPHLSSFRYRIISGASSHDRTIDIQPDDNLLIVSKDSVGRNLPCLDRWLAGEQEVFLVVDEAHHSTARTYRKVIDYLRGRVPHVKLIGLTATPFRTAGAEQGLLAKIYEDDIAYQIGLKDLIKRQILSKPVFEAYYTGEEYGGSLGLDAWESIERLDTLPEDVAEQIARSTPRNKLIVDTYRAAPEKYGQTIVFAVNVIHAIQLAALFNRGTGGKEDKIADFIVSNVKDAVTGVTTGRKDNEEKIERYRQRKLKVLINVNILTEGVDLPKTQSVFLARPTVSTILMTQMVGRALRGPSAGGTDKAYIVSFVDNWDEHIAWVNPESLFKGNNEFSDSPAVRAQQDLRMIAISKIEEFASILSDAVDTTALEQVPFSQRIPLGMYAFTYLEENGMDLSYQVMVYDSTAGAYQELMDALPALFKSYHVAEEYPTERMLSAMERQCRDTFFCGKMIPPYEERDVLSILRYYAQYEAVPTFYTFDEIDRSKLDVSQIARHIWDNSLGGPKRQAYINSLWESGDDNMLRLFFGRKLYFMRQIDIEYMKIAEPDIYQDQQNVRYGTRKLEDLPLYELGKIDPAREKALRDGAFAKGRTSTGEYRCACCGMTDRSRVFFQVDHIVPMNKGGKSVPENLQILCRKCNGGKGDR